MNAKWDESERNWQGGTDGFDRQTIDYGTPSTAPFGSDSQLFGSANGGSESQNDLEVPPPTTFSGVLINGFCLLVITLLLAFIFLGQSQPTGEPTPPSPQAELVNLTIQAKFFIGFRELVNNNPALRKQQSDLEKVLIINPSGSVRMRQAAAVVKAELTSPDDALVDLTKLNLLAIQSGYQFTETEKQTDAILQKLFMQSADALNADERKHLKEELLWFGDLALNLEVKPAGRAKAAGDNPERQAILENASNTALILGGLGFLALAGFLAGLVGGFIMLILYGSGRLKIRTPAVSPESSIYLESFTVWLCSFILFSVVVGFIAPDSNPVVANAIVFVASLLVAIIWPVLRGRFSKRFCRDAGLTGNPLIEIPAALWSYICILPLVAVGLIVSSALAEAYVEETTDAISTSSGPTHPILEWVMSGDRGTIFLILVVACVCAPVVEEIMFRGFLYRSLKDNSFRFGHFLSTLFAAVVNGLLFAAIHPQGIFLIPALCSLGVGFSLAREWRGTLWTPILMHALHNGILTCSMIYILTN